MSLTAQCDAIDMDRYRNNKSRSCDVAHVTRASLDMVEHDSSFDSFPLGATVLEPDLYLDLAEMQLTSDQRTLGQRQVLFAGELTFQFDQLVATECRPPPSVTFVR